MVDVSSVKTRTSEDIFIKIGLYLEWQIAIIVAFGFHEKDKERMLE